MKPLMERRAFFLEIILCTAVFPLLAAVLVVRRPENALLFLLGSSFCVAAAVLALCRRYLQMRV